MNIGQLTRMGQEMQANMARVQQELRSVEIDPATVDASDVELLQDLVFAAVTDALAQSKRLAEEKMAAISGGLGLPGLPGLR